MGSSIRSWFLSALLLLLGGSDVFAAEAAESQSLSETALKELRDRLVDHAYCAEIRLHQNHPGHRSVTAETAA